jgi:hypothetical protein
VGFVGYGLWFCLTDVELRMGVSRRFATTKGGATLPVLGDLLAKTRVLGRCTPQECVLVVLLLAYLGSYFSWISVMGGMPGCPPIVVDGVLLPSRTFLLVSKLCFSSTNTVAILYVKVHEFT